MKETFARLKSGTDIRGVAVEEAGKTATLTEDIGSAVGVAFARWLAAAQGKPVEALKIAVGRDSRVSGESLAGAMMHGLHAASAQVLDCGLCTTPAMFMSTQLLGCDGAVMVTASHQPWDRNGYKFFTPRGGLDGSDITALLDAASNISSVRGVTENAKVDLLTKYTSFLHAMVCKALEDDRPLSGLHIVVDAGNGAGGFYADYLASLGADTAGSQFLEPDGLFPNHIPNPEAPEAMASLSRAVLRAGADLGVIFDTDCDRAALVGPDGQEINGNRFIALVSAMLLGEKQGITVVTDSVVSAGLGVFMEAHGGTLYRFKRGYRNVIDEAVRLNNEGIDCPLAMETSGHAALRENHFLDDGMYLVTRLIIEAKRLRADGRTLGSLIAGLEEPADAMELRLSILAEDFRSAGADIIAAIEKKVGKRPEIAIDTGNREGIRLQFGTPARWVLLRLSVHDPVVVINAESDQAGGVLQMLRTLREMLPAGSQLDVSALDARVNTSI